MRGAAVTINAMSYQCEVVANPMERRADCIVAVKHNRPALTWETLPCYGPKGLSQGRLQQTTTTEKRHDCIETRRCEVSATDILDKSLTA